MNIHNFTRTLVLSGMLFAGTQAFAAEKTGGQLKELIQEMNSELAEARQKIQKLDAARAAKQKAQPKKDLTQRKKALKDLEKVAEKMNNAPDDASRKAHAQELEQKIVAISEHSADYLSGMKNELVHQNKQMSLMEDVLSGVLVKLDKLQQLAEKRGNGSKSDEEIAAAKAQIKNTAHIVEMLSRNSPKGQRWKSVRQTLVVQHAMLKPGMLSAARLRATLKGQKQAYEQALAQISEARQQLELDKQLLAEAALGEVAQGSLRQLAGLLLGEMNVEKIGDRIIATSTERRNSLIDFVEQNNDGSGLDPAGNGSDEQPDGFADLLK